VPSSLIFASLVVIWLLILLPAVARRRHELPHPSTAALSGRVLPRTVRHRTEEVDQVPTAQANPPDPDPADPASNPGAAGPPQADPADTGDGSRCPAEPPQMRADDDAAAEQWERPPPRYRPGRGGFDAAAAELAAQTRYRVRQRVVLILLVAAALSAGAAVLIGSRLWEVHGAVDVLLVGYLGYLRRQVRLEEAVRQRRASRMAGTRRTAAAEDPTLDEWAHRGRAAAAGEGEPADGESAEGRHGAPPPPSAGDEASPQEDATAPAAATADATAAPAARADADPADDGCAGGGVGRGTCGEAGREPDEGPEPEPTLPRLRPVAPPSLPAGTTLLGEHDLDPELPSFDQRWRPYRRASGQ